MKTSLNAEEREMVYLLASQLTGTCQEGNFRHEILVTNVLRRIHKNSQASLEDYLEFVEEHPKEMPFLLSALTIHTTNWFREKPHYDRFTGILNDFFAKTPKEKFRMLCAACSTGEEVYSFALMLEDFRLKHPGFEYEIFGRDIDPVSVKKALRCVYPEVGLKDIPDSFSKFVLKGSGKTKGLITLDRSIRSNCSFEPRSLINPPEPGDKKFHYVVCRNVLIYFSPEEVDKIVQNLLASLVPDGLLTVGHSEALDFRKFGIKSLGHSSYTKAIGATEKKDSINRTQSRVTKASIKPAVDAKFRVLVVDDSPTVRNMMMKLIQGLKFDVVGANDAIHADEILVKDSNFDIITLDLHMPKKDGQTWLLEKRAAGMTTPVVIVSDANPREAQQVLNVLGNGAQDYIEKKDLNAQKMNIQNRLLAIVQNKILVAEELSSGKTGNYSTDPSSVDVFKPELIVLGASTGGTEALVRTIRDVGANCPPVVVVQHISVDFSQAFATRLAQASGLTLGAPGEELAPGKLYMSTSDQHIGVKRKGEKLVCFLEEGPKVSSHRPSVDFMFDSVDKLKVPVFAALLTGMGKDGAKGLLNLHRSGAMTSAQDAESSIVWGMPGEATKIGAASFVGTTEDIRTMLDRSISAPQRKKAA